MVRDDAISRFALVLSLGMLRRQEVVEAVVKGVEASGEGTIPKRLAGRIATASMGFPQHVHGFVEASIRVLQTHGSLRSRQAEVEVLATGNERRQRFYELRLTSLAPRHQQGVVQIAAAMEERRGTAEIGWNEAAAIVDGAVPGIDPAEAIESAVEKGIFSASPTGVLTFPIPSFHRYVLRLLEERDAGSAAR